MNIYAFDLETTTKQPAVAYLCGYCPINDYNNLKVYYNIKDFLIDILALPKGSILYAHNLKFDYSYIFNAISTCDEFKKYKPKETIVGITKKVLRVKINRIELRDSFMLFSKDLNSVMGGWNDKFTKKIGGVEYYEKVPDKISPVMLEYFERDILGLCEALSKRIPMGYNKLTTSSDSKEEIKETINAKYNLIKKNSFSDWFFPSLNRETDTNIRRYYRGGYCYLSPQYANTVIKDKVSILDVNSMYPYVMYNYDMPYGDPIKFKGKPNPKIQKLFIVTIKVNWCCVKENCVPFLVNGAVNSFFSTEYCREVYEEDNEEMRIFRLSNLEYYKFKETYTHGEIEYLGGYYFKSQRDMFKDYIDKYIAIKQNSSGAMRECAKLFLNAPSGKWGENPDQSKYHSKLVGGVQKFVEVEKTFRDKNKPGFYIPVSLFITSISRMILIGKINEIFDKFVYCDTDSIHMLGTDYSNFNIDNNKLGYWKNEGGFTPSKYLRTKRYAHHDHTGKLKFTCAGIGKKWFSGLKTIEEFEEGRKIPVMRMKMVKGGMQPEMVDISI